MFIYSALNWLLLAHKRSVGLLVAGCWLVLLGSGCQQDGGTSGGKSVSGVSETNAYFGLNNFFQSEMQRLKTNKTALQKTASLNGKTETQNLPDANWEKELSLFAMSDINKPAWANSYTADTIQQNGNTQVTYTATNPALRTQKIVLQFEPATSQPISVGISNKVENFIYQLSENLTYHTRQGFEVNTTQKVILMKPQQFAVKAVFAPAPK